MVETLNLLKDALAMHPDRQRMEPDTVNRLAGGWHSLLGHLDHDLAKAALHKVLAVSPYFPKPSDLLKAALELSLPDHKGAEDAWGEVLREQRRVGSYGKPVFSTPLIAEAVKHMWGRWASACEMQTETMGVDRAQFMRLYDTLQKRAKESLLLPPSVTAFQAELTARLRPPGWEPPAQLAPPVNHDEVIATMRQDMETQISELSVDPVMVERARQLLDAARNRSE